MQALTVGKPKQIYYVGTDAKLSNALDRLLPGRLRDRFIMKKMGLDG